MKLIEAMLLNGRLFNSEAKYGVTHAQIVKLENIYEALLGCILKAHCKIISLFGNRIYPNQIFFLSQRNRSDEELIE